MFNKIDKQTKIIILVILIVVVVYLLNKKENVDGSISTSSSQISKINIDVPESKNNANVLPNSSAQVKSRSSVSTPVVTESYSMNQKDNILSTVMSSVSKCKLDSYMSEQRKNISELENISRQYESRDRLEQLHNTLMDDVANDIINDSVNKFTKLSYEDVYCMYNDSEKNKLLCNNLGNLNEVNINHIKINDLLDRYTEPIRKIKTHLLNCLMYIVNKDCTDLKHKNVLISRHIDELNETLERLHSILKINDNEKKEMLNIINQ